MRQKRTFVTLLLVIALLCLGIGYAVIDDITLTIGGDVKASPDGANFVVKFKDNGTANVTVGPDAAVATPTASGTAAELNVTGLTAAGDTVVATWTIENTSPDLLANVSLKTGEVTGNADYFEISAEIADADEDTGIASLAAVNGSTTVTVTVKLVKTPIDSDVTGTIKVELLAEPVQPTVE